MRREHWGDLVGVSQVLRAGLAKCSLQIARIKLNNTGENRQEWRGYHGRQNSRLDERLRKRQKLWTSL
jgi:hypothetical protein